MITDQALAHKYPYCPCYCEENIWHLARKLLRSGDELRVIVISNITGQVALWQQKKSQAKDLPVIWDYHVILTAKTAQLTTIWDFDSSLPFPINAGDYLNQTFPSDLNYCQELHPVFRLLTAESFVENFCSDRRHMYHQGKWLSTPPSWPTIGSGHNLAEFVNMKNTKYGTLLSLDGLKQALL